MASATPAVEERAKELSRRGRKAAKKAAKKAEAAAEEARKQAKKQGRQAPRSTVAAPRRRSSTSPTTPSPRAPSWPTRRTKASELVDSAERQPIAVGEVLAQVADEVDEEATLREPPAPVVALEGVVVAAGDDRLQRRRAHLLQHEVGGARGRWPALVVDVEHEFVTRCLVRGEPSCSCVPAA